MTPFFLHCVSGYGKPLDRLDQGTRSLPQFEQLKLQSSGLISVAASLEIDIWQWTANTQRDCVSSSHHLILMLSHGGILIHTDAAWLPVDDSVVHFSMIPCAHGYLVCRCTPLQLICLQLFY